ncbi:MAG TPA: hypothetical protein VNY06_00445 [Methylocella sp.]|jgi:hypothetical protein|nr:hypothetical protein [Methylocella sp.]
MITADVRLIMAERPPINPGDWITVGEIRAVVSAVREPDNFSGDCEVVFNPQKPTNHDVVWTGEKWRFAERSDFGGYADKYPRLRQYVSILKRGPR